VRERPRHVALRVVTDREKVSYPRGVPGKLQEHLFLERAEGYVNVLEKSSSRVMGRREVFESVPERLGRRREPESRFVSSAYS